MRATIRAALNLLKHTAAADASIDQVKNGIKGVQAQPTLIVRLENGALGLVA